MGDQHEYITTQLPGKFILWGGPLILFYPSCHFIDLALLLIREIYPIFK